MILAQEARDVSGRLLLSRGKTIDKNHIRVLKIWGVTEIKVLGYCSSQDENKLDSDLVGNDRIMDKTLKALYHNDLEHPAIKEIFRLSVWFRAKYGSYTENDDLTALQGTEPVNKVGKKFKNIIVYPNIKLPEVPSIVFELNEVIANPRASAQDIAKVVQKSPSLTAILLKIVNSAFYGFLSKIDKISSAVILIGTRQIAGLALGLSIFSVFDKIPKNLIDMQSFLKHGFACGIIARMLASQKGIPQTEHFFVSGLLHDVGRLILYCNFPDDSRKVLFHSNANNKLLYQVEKNYFNFDHTDVAKSLIGKWKLPLSLENNIIHHHSPSEAPHPIPATLVHVADIITNGLGIGTSGERGVPALDTKAWDSLGLSPFCFEVVVKQAIHQFSALEAIVEI